jgi:hypothetical protein
VLHQEKNNSRLAIANLMKEVEAVMMEATKAKKDLKSTQIELNNTKLLAAEMVALEQQMCKDAISDEKQRSKMKLRVERQRIHEVKKLERDKAIAALEKEKQKFEEKMSKATATLDREREATEKAIQNAAQLVSKAKTTSQNTVRQERQYHSDHIHSGKSVFQVC